MAGATKARPRVVQIGKALAGSITAYDTRMKTRPITLPLGQIYQDGKVLDQRLANAKKAGE